MVINGTSNHNEEAKSSSIDSTLIDVEGYSVKNEAVASMLRRIFDKHKDIARDCKIKSRAIIVPVLEMICSYCQKLENTTLETVMESEVEDMTVVVESFQQIGFDFKWLIERLKDVSEMKGPVNDYFALYKEHSIKEKEVEILKQKLSVAEAQLVTVEMEFDKVRHSVRQFITSKPKEIILCSKSLLDGMI